MANCGSRDLVEGIGERQAGAPIEAAFGTSMRIQVELRIVADDNSVISEGEILHFDKGDDRLEGIGLSFDEAKAALAGIQGGVVTAQAASFLARHRSCDLCGSLLLSKGLGRTRFRTAFGTIALPSPRFHSCRCQPKADKTFSPLNLLLTERVAPELLYVDRRPSLDHELERLKPLIF